MTLRRAAGTILGYASLPLVLLIIICAAIFLPEEPEQHDQGD